MKKTFLILSAMACLVICGCTTLPEANQEVNHVVLFWLKEPGSRMQCENIIRASHSFTNIPGVISVRAGRSLSSNREVVDDSFDVATVIILKDASCMDTFLAHPLHVKANNEVLVPFVRKITVYNFTE